LRIFVHSALAVTAGPSADRRAVSLDSHDALVWARTWSATLSTATLGLVWLSAAGWGALRSGSSQPSSSPWHPLPSEKLTPRRPTRRRRSPRRSSGAPWWLAPGHALVRSPSGAPLRSPAERSGSSGFCLPRRSGRSTLLG
jgi:hypothetical protein